MANSTFTSIEQLFGELEKRTADPGRSVYSPAAYLADLLQLLEVHFGRLDASDSDPAFFSRRGDVESIPLNGEEAFTTLPYLDIVNRILEEKIKSEEASPADEQEAPYGRLRDRRYPFHLPFDLEDSRYRKFLSFTKAKSHEIYRAYQKEQEEAKVIAQEYLGLPQVVYSFLTEVPANAKAWLQTHYGFASDTSLADMHAALADVNQFLKITEIDGEALRMLLYQNLSFTANPSEVTLAANAFINAGTTNYAFVPLTEEEVSDEHPADTIQWGALPNDTEAEIVASDWYRRLRATVLLLRLSKVTGMSTVELNTILSQCCGNLLDTHTVPLIATIKYISEMYEQPIDSVCCLVAGLSDRGQGNGADPADLFNRTFNTPFVRFDKTYLQLGEHLPKAYGDYTLLESNDSTADILNSANQDYRRRVQRALGMSERDFYYVVNRFRVKFHDSMVNHPLAADQPLAAEGLSLLYRVTRLAQWMEVGYPDFFALLEVLEYDPAIRAFSPFTLLLSLKIQEEDAFQIVQGGSEPMQAFTTPLQVSEGLWLAQLLLTMGKWMEKSDLSGQDLKYVLTGERPSPQAEKLLWSNTWTTAELVDELTELKEKEDATADQQTISFLNDTYQNFKPTLVGAELFRSDRFSARAARNIHHCLQIYGQLVDSTDARILRYQEAEARSFASSALQNLEVINAADFLELGLADKLADKFFRNLIIKGYIDPDGRLIESMFPDQVEDFHINFTNAPESEELFGILHALYRSEAAQQGEEVEMTLFPSDLADLSVSEQRRTELFDNLIYNGYIDADGNVVQVDFFADMANASQFEASSKLQVHAPKVYALIQAATQRFKRAQLKLDEQIFAHLPLQALELKELVANLSFNGYLDAMGAYADKAAILALTPENFRLEARLHYHHGAAILAAMQQQLQAFKTEFYTLTVEQLLPLSDEIVASMIYEALAEKQLEDHRWPAARRTDLYDPARATDLDLPAYFDANDHAVIWRRLEEFLSEAEQYHLNDRNLQDFGLTEQEIADICDELIAQNYLLADKSIATDKLPYFLNSSNALAFSVAGYEDFSRDLFFELQTLSVAITEGSDELVDKLKTRAQLQEEVLIKGLSGLLELPSDSVRIILAHLLGTNGHLAGALAAPLVGTVNEDELINKLPEHALFNIQLRRLQQLAAMALKFRLSTGDLELILLDQHLVDKLPENLRLPEGFNTFDTLLEDGDEILLFIGNQYYTYSKATYELAEEIQQPRSLADLSPEFENFQTIDAAFTDPHGHTWIVAAGMYYRREQGRFHFEMQEKTWGVVDDNFNDPEHIDAAFIDHEGKLYLFADDQYVRYSAYSYFNADGTPVQMDEGYPKRIAGNWREELLFDLPESYGNGINAAFASTNGHTYLFKGSTFISSESAGEEMAIVDKWGLVRNDFLASTTIDAALDIGNATVLYAGEQQMIFRDSLENAGVLGMEGSLTKIRSHFEQEDVNIEFPDEFLHQVDGGTVGLDGFVHLFSGDKCFSAHPQTGATSSPTNLHTPATWGIVDNHIQDGGLIQAAFAGLDGRSYLFTNRQYVRYSRSDHSVIDEGYPRAISSDWGGLKTVDAAFVLGGKTYLFGTDEDGQHAYVCYSTSDYSEPDKGYPKYLSMEESFWNFTDADELLPDDKRRFARPEAVFVSKDEQVYLCKDDMFISSDHNLRWWTKPQPFSKLWHDLSFTSIAAAFTARNGTTYVFAPYTISLQEENDEEGRGLDSPTVTSRAAKVSPATPGGQPFVSYTDTEFTRVDHRTPAYVEDVWGRLVNNIARTGRVNAAVQLRSLPTELDEDGRMVYLPEEDHLYLFSGSQFYRYTWRINPVEPVYGSSGGEGEMAEAPHTIIAWTETIDEYGSTQEIPYEMEAYFQYIPGTEQRGMPRLETYVDEGYPKLIDESLRKEPRFTQLPKDFKGPLQAASADKKNVYLFTTAGMTAVAEPQREDTDLIVYLAEPVEAVFMERGAIMVRNQQKEEARSLTTDLEHHWFHHNSIEARQALREAYLPEALRAAPTDFITEASAVLLGTDGHTYIFKDTDCFNVSMAQAYPISKDWGKVRNHIVEQERVDAAFLGLDGHTYLFSDDQFVMYKGDVADPKAFAARVDGLPRLVADHWCGLRNVRLAFTLDHKTYLVEQWDASGNFRYLCLHGDDYDKAKTAVASMHAGMKGDGYSSNGYATDENGLQYANFRDWSVLNIPAEYFDYEGEGSFQHVHAVLQKDEHLFLLSADHFVHYNRTEKVWSYPRPINQSWEDLALLLPDTKGFTPDLEHLHTAFMGPNKHLYFFGPKTWVSYNYDRNEFGELTDISERWGILENNLQDKENIMPVDAAFVLDGKTTYLFSGEDFYRYSTSNYRYVDEGYPKRVLSDLRKEPGFEQLPEGFENAFQAKWSTGDQLMGIVSNARNIYVFLRNRCFIARREAAHTYQPGQLGYIKNQIAEEQRIDAVYVNREGHTILVANDQAFRYTHAYFDYDEEVFVDDGYPKSLATQLELDGYSDIPLGFTFDVDAAVFTNNQRLYLFKETLFYASDEDLTKDVKGQWGQYADDFDLQVDDRNVQAMIIAPDGNTYIFAGDHYVRYSDFDNDYVDEGYPKPIADNWGELDPTFEGGIDGAFVFEGHTYFIKGTDYVRYTDAGFRRVEGSSTRTFSTHWRRWNDFLLGDLKVISQYAQMKEAYDGDGELTQFFVGKDGQNKTPFALLAEVFDWELEEIEWLKRRNAFVDKENTVETRFSLEEMLHLQQIFELARRVGTQPEDLYTNVWRPRFLTALDDTLTATQHQQALRDAADAVYRYLGENNSWKDWQILERQIDDELNLIKRDTLLPYLLHILPAELEIENERDLYNHLLIDVLMGSEAKTSNIKEAISAVQLYMHRFQVNLESPNTSLLSDARREDLKQWWKWMKNYRVWEANRKVFLYPENYIRPELRDTKSPEFEKLEQSLLQGELSAEQALTAYYEYLDGFSVVGNLNIAGANVYQDDGKEAVVLFGHTRAEPLEYYYRTACFDGDLAEWKPWSKLELTMNATRVFPVHAFGRLLVFWIEIEDLEESEGKLLGTANGEAMEVDVQTNKKRLVHRAHVRFSYYNYTKRWSAPQLVKGGIPLAYEIDSAYVDSDKTTTVIFSGKYCMKTTPANPSGEVKLINEYDEFKPLPASFQSGIEAATIFNGFRYFFKGGSCYRQRLSDLTGEEMPIRDLFIIPAVITWVVVVIKGPFGTSHSQLVQFDPSSGANDPFPSDGFDAAFQIDSNILCLIDKRGNYFFYTPSGDQLTPLQEFKNVQTDFGPFELVMSTVANKGGKFAPADAVFKKPDPETGQDILFILRDGEYECYSSNGSELVPLPGFPKPIRGNLSFNMDKFFDKLHVVWDGDSRGKISLNYQDPKNKQLLHGHLHADLMFEEVQPEDDQLNISLTAWDSLMTDNLQPYPDFDSDNYTDSESKNLHDTTVELHTSLDKLLQLTAASSQLETAADELKNIGDADTSSEESQARSSYSTAKSTGTSAIATLKNDSDDTIKGIAKNLDAGFTSLQDALDNFDGDEDNPLAGDAEHLSDESAVVKGIVTAENDDIRTYRDPILDSLNSMVGDPNDADQAGSHDSSLTRENMESHAQNVSLFASFQTSVTSMLQVWGGADPGKYLTADNSPELMAAPGLEDTYRTNNTDFLNALNDGVADLKSAQVDADDGNWTNVLTHLNDAKDHFVTAEAKHDARTTAKTAVDNSKAQILREGALIYNQLFESQEGKDDRFDGTFNIQNTTNFTFGEPNWYIFKAQRGTFMCRPRDGSNDGMYELIRLTSTMDPIFSTNLFVDGMEGLLGLNTQLNGDQPESPKLGDGGVTFNTSRFKEVNELPGLDFSGANQNYYWEIFFHAPYLVAQSLNTAQQFEAAKEWYEYIFDPAKTPAPWLFLPFTDSHRSAEGNFLLDANQMERYQNDPFDPHAIAALRPSAYQRAILMNYVDNLLDWGDSLFRRYSVESINEARMLYILAYDLLGDQPDGLGIRILSEDQNYTDYRSDLQAANLIDYQEELEFLFEIENDLSMDDSAPLVNPTPNDNILNLYFYIPENELFLKYWDRVEDRLYKIRQSLNIDGKKQPLPLFEPPIDPMALVRAVAGGASISQAIGGLDVAVPPYRFNFMLAKARELTQKLNQYGGELLAALEKKDAEVLTRLQTRQEGEIHALTQRLRYTQIEEAEMNIVSLKASLKNADERISHYEAVIEYGILPTEALQITLMGLGSISQLTSAGLKIISAIVSTSTPDALMGPFIMGVKYGGSNVGQGLDTASDVLQTVGESLSMAGETLGIVAQFQRMKEDWDLQLAMAEADKEQIEAQILGAELQLQAAKYELLLVNKQIDHNKDMATFLRDKFSNQELYQWMIGQMSGLYYQTYQLAYDMAKYAEKSYQFERAAPRELVSFIQPNYWNSQRQGLLAGEQLGLDLDRMEQDYIKTDDLRLSVSKNISLLELDPVAFHTFRDIGVCEFNLTEALFDYDFPGHYLRQIKTISISFDIGEGKTLDAMLTQLSHRTVMEADTKGVKYLLNPREKQPLSVRSDWKVNQQIALSHHDEYEKNNGMFELRFDTDLYLPFEGTGAVSSWRLELKGRHGRTLVRDMTDMVINVKYTAVDGGQVFADSVKGMLKPYLTTRYFDLNYDFNNEWLDFLDSDSDTFTMPMTRDLFPNMASGKIVSIFSKFDLLDDGRLKVVLNNDEDMELKDGKVLDTTSLNIGSRGSEWTLRIKGDKQLLRTVYLVLGYKAKVQ